MTTVTLHGIAKKEFGENLKLEISSLKELCAAIDANRPGFIKKIKDLAAQGMHYAFIVNGEKIINLQKFPEKEKIKTIDVVPMIVGKGPLAPLLIPIISSAATGALGAAFAAGTIGAGTFILGSIAIGIGSLLLGQLFAPKADEPPGIESTTRALSQSFAFSNKANIAAQGTPVPVGYGELLVGSNIIQYSSKNFPQSYKSTDAFRQGQDGQSIVSVAKTPIFEEVNWTDTPPKQVFSWANGMGVKGTTHFYYDPDPDHNGGTAATVDRHGVNYPEVFGSVAITVQNDENFNVSVYVMNKNKMKLWPINWDGWVDDGGATDWTNAGTWYRINDELQPGQKKTMMLNGAGYVRFGKEEAYSRLAAVDPEPLVYPPYTSERYRYGELGQYINGMNDITALDEWLIYIVYHSNNDGGGNSFDDCPFNVFTKQNVITERRVILRTDLNYMWWNNVCQGLFSNGVFACYRYPFGDCNGKFCIANQAPTQFDSTLQWVRSDCATGVFPGWEYRLPPDTFSGTISNYNQNYAPCICEPSGDGPQLQINLKENGGSETNVSWSKIPKNQWYGTYAP